MQEKKPIRILIVEDDYHISRILQLAMTQSGVPCQQDSALSAEEALEMWQKQSYDLLLTDHNLRGMTGLQLIRTLRSQGEQVPIIMMTAYDTPQLEREVRSLGISAYIPKPFLIEEVVAAIERVLR
jgi:Response regulator containing CheY-like receiver, AAA-type ATPase, and DNA-binding domains